MPKLADEPQLAEFLQEQQACTIATAIDTEGTIHIAAITYWHQTDPWEFYFVAGKDSEKCTMLQDGQPHAGACVVGTVVDTPFTVQMRGTLQIVPKEEHAVKIESYAKKRGNTHGVEKPENVLLVFRPTWARFTDYSKGWDTYPLELS